MSTGEFATTSLSEDPTSGNTENQLGIDAADNDFADNDQQFNGVPEQSDEEIVEDDEGSESCYNQNRGRR